MSTQVSGTITAFFLYDVAEAIDLGRVQQEVAGGVAARLVPKPTTPPYVQYRQPPITIDGRAVDAPECDGFAARFKVFDYGVVSVALSRPITGTWEDWLRDGLACHENPLLARSGERLAQSLVDRLRSAIIKPNSPFLAEDYLVFAMTTL